MFVFYLIFLRLFYKNFTNLPLSSNFTFKLCKKIQISLTDSRQYTYPCFYFSEMKTKTLTHYNIYIKNIIKKPLIHSDEEMLFNFWIKQSLLNMHRWIIIMINLHVVWIKYAVNKYCHEQEKSTHVSEQPIST